jgi:hypothetical protein
MDMTMRITIFYPKRTNICGSGLLGRIEIGALYRQRRSLACLVSLVSDEITTAHDDGSQDPAGGGPC